MDKLKFFRETEHLQETRTEERGFTYLNEDVPSRKFGGRIETCFLLGLYVNEMLDLDEPIKMN